MPSDLRHLNTALPPGENLSAPSQDPTPKSDQGNQGVAGHSGKKTEADLEPRWFSPADSYLVNGVKPVQLHDQHSPLGPAASPETYSWTRGHQPT